MNPLTKNTPMIVWKGRSSPVQNLSADQGCHQPVSIDNDH